MIDDLIKQTDCYKRLIVCDIHLLWAFVTYLKLVILCLSYDLWQFSV